MNVVMIFEIISAVVSIIASTATIITIIISCYKDSK